MSDCAPSKILSTNVTIIYGVFYGILLLVISIYSFNYLMEFDAKFQRSGRFKQFKMWSKDAWKRKSCYIPLIAHLFDQITDVAVTIQFFELAQKKSNNGEWTDCNGLNIWYLFILTILSMIVYRAVSSYLIYKITNSIKRVILQIFDLELFKTLYINYLCNKTEPCDPQRWLTALEAALESSPQALIQLIFLVKTGAVTLNYLILISLLSSFWSIISKLVSDDKIIVVQGAKRPDSNFTFFYCVLVIVLLCCYIIYICAVFIPYSMFLLLRSFEGRSYRDNCNEIIRVMLCPLVAISNKVTCTYPYELRVVWRIFDVWSHILLMVFIWISIGGTALAIKVGFESVVFLVVCVKTNKWELLFGLVALVMSMATENLELISVVICWYRIVTNFILMLLVTVWLCVDFECVRCTEYIERQQLALDPIILGFFAYTWFAIMLNSISFVFLVRNKIFEKGKSNSRNLVQMADTDNFDGILEIQLYGNKYRMYDEAKKTTLLMLAVREQRIPIISYLLAKLDADHLNDCDAQGLNVLDWYHKGMVNQQKKKVSTKKTMVNVLNNICRIQPNLVDISGRNATLCGCHSKERGVLAMAKSLELEEKYILSQDKDGKTFCDYIWDDLGNIDCFELYKKYPKFVEIDGGSPFFYYCEKGNDACAKVQKLLESYPSLIYRVDKDGDNILDFYLNSKDLLTNETILNLNQFDPEIRSSNHSKMTLFLCVVQNANMQLMEQLISIRPDCVHHTDESGKGIFHYLGDNINKIDCFDFYGQFPTFVEIDGISLFFYHCKLGNADIVQELLKLHPTLIDRYDENKKNVLDYYLQNKNLLTSDSILYLNKLDTEITSADNAHLSLFLCAVRNANGEAMEQLISIDPHCIHHTDANGNGFFHYLWQNLKPAKFDCFSFYKQFPSAAAMDGRSPFFYRCEEGDGDIVCKLLMLYPELIKTRDMNKENVLNHYYRNKNVLTKDAILYINKLEPEIRSLPIVSWKQSLPLFLLVASHGNQQCMKQLIECDGKVLYQEDVNGRNVGDILLDKYRDELYEWLFVEYGITANHYAKGKKEADVQATFEPHGYRKYKKSVLSSDEEMRFSYN